MKANEMRSRFAAMAATIAVILLCFAPSNVGASWCQQCPLATACEVPGAFPSDSWTWCGAEDLTTKCRDYYKRRRNCIQPPNTYMEVSRFEETIPGSCTTEACF
jgi:hypothetical protein